MKKIICLFGISILYLNVYSQIDPIKFENNHWTLRVDTFQKLNSKWNCSIPWQETYTYTFQNIGTHLTFIDTNSNDLYLTKPSQYTTIRINESDFERQSHKFENQNKHYFQFGTYTDTCVLPFYYEGKLFRHEIYFTKTQDRNRFLDFKTNQFDLTDSISKFFSYDPETDSTSNSGISFVFYLPITNKSNEVIFCIKEMYLYNDTDIRNNEGNGMTEIKPKSTYFLPIKCNLGYKYMFNKTGTIIVSKNYTKEIYCFSVFSNFRPKGKTRW